MERKMLKDIHSNVISNFKAHVQLWLGKLLQIKIWLFLINASLTTISTVIQAYRVIVKCKWQFYI